MDELARRQRPRRVGSKSQARTFAVLSGFDPKALVMTDDGPVPFEWLSTGMLLATRDAGFQPIIWIDRTRLDQETIRKFPEYAPVYLDKGMLGGGMPLSGFHLSPSQTLHVSRDPEEPSGGGVLINAEVICAKPDPRAAAQNGMVTYISVMLPTHQLIHVEGAWMGSLFTADLASDLPKDDPVGAKLVEDVMTPIAPMLTEPEARAFLHSRLAKAGRKTA